MRRRESFIHVEVDRITDPARLDALAADIARVLARRAHGGRGLEEDAGQDARHRRRPRRAPAAARRRTSSPKARRSWAGSPTTTSRCWATAATTSSRSTARTRCGSFPARASGSCARLAGATSRRASPCCRRSSAAFARLPELLIITKANSRSTVHRPGYLDYVGIKRFDAKRAGLRRASLPRPVHVDRVQREAGRHTAVAAQDRPRRRARRPRARQPRRQGADQHPRDLSARRAPADERRRPLLRPRWASSISASGSASGCSSAAIRSDASCRASSSRRARTTRPNCARSGRRS